jgi:hypothetical protein
MGKVITMADIHKQIVEEYHKKLLANAVDCTQYVAMGKVAVDDVVKKYSIPEKDAEYILSVLCDHLCRKIKDVKQPRV